MRKPEERAEMIRQQLASKVQWGVSEDEATAWLSSQAVVGPAAEAMLTEAYEARRKLVKERALVPVIVSAVVVALAAAYFYVSLFSGLVTTGVVLNVIVGVVGLYSLLSFIRNLSRFQTGEAPGPV